MAVQDGDPASMLELYRAALRLRRAHPALGDGSLRWLETPGGVLAFARDPGFACVVNVSGQPAPFPPRHGAAGQRPLTPEGAVRGHRRLAARSGRRVALVVGEVAVELLAGRPLGDGVDEVLAADEGALPGGAAAAERLGLVARERGRLIPTLKAWTWSARRRARCSSSQAIEATRQPLEAFISATSSAAESTRTTVSTGPNGSAWPSALAPGGSSRATGGR